jgi:D-lactate dehydrogenase
MKIIIYSAKSFEKKHINDANQRTHKLCFVWDALTLKTAYKSKGYDAVSCFLANYMDEELMAKLAENGIKFITLRSAGYDDAHGLAAKEHKKQLLAHLNTRHKQFLDLRCA